MVVLCFAALALPAGADARPVRSAIFFYPWYSNAAHDGAFTHWQQNAHAPPHDIASAFFPMRGAYSSADPRVLRAQMREIAAAGVDEVVSSWWGRGSPEAERLSAVIRAARSSGLRVGVQLEPYAGRTVASIVADLATLRALRIRDLYVYRAGDISASEWKALSLSLSGFRVLAQTGLPGFAARGGFAGFYTYDVEVFGGAKLGRLCAEAHAVGILCAPSVGPGYDARRATGDLRLKPRAHGRTYDSMWRAALAADADLVTITSYNEWSEGTQIEPARVVRGYESYDGAYGLHGRRAQDAYLRATARWTRLLRRR